MDYFINQTIHFNSTNGLLKLIDNDNSTIQLSKPGSRLLTELITHCGNTMTREDLLQLVWEEHGLRPSGSNLSNHISLLRKTFSQFGFNENIIITVPKKGFRLDAEVILTKAAPHTDDNSVTKTINKNEITPPILPASNECELKPKIKKKCLVSVLVISLFFTSLILMSYSFNSRKADFIEIGTCQMLDLAVDKNKNRVEKLKILELLINKNQLDCKKNKSIIYFNFSNFFPKKNYEQSAIFLSQCYQDRKNRLTDCESYLSATIKKP
ncbi:transcriptional regulator [Erwinia sp. AnSW2-5]|uniref:winged helix-turn-helix domain-containing protein n=1 Tax=Erwinia sp. AnSW2-5 TaxID=3367692 RepID=UPI00385C6E1D